MQLEEVLLLHLTLWVKMCELFTQELIYFGHCVYLRSFSFILWADVFDLWGTSQERLSRLTFERCCVAQHNILIIQPA